MNYSPNTIRTAITALLVFSLTACGKSGPDLSTPEKSAKAFGTALDTGDLELAKAVCVTTPESARMIGALVPLSRAMKDLREAAKAKFGKEAGALGTGEDVVTQLSKAKMSVSGDTATLTPTAGATKQPITLKKINGSWRVEVKSMTPGAAGDKSAAESELALKNLETLFRAMTVASMAVTSSIKSGKYKRVEEAQTDVNLKVRAEIMTIQAASAGKRPPAGSTNVKPDPNGTAPGPRNEGGMIAPGQTGNSKKF